MNEILKVAKLDFYLMKPYFKSLWATVVIPIVLAVIYKSLFFGVFLAVGMSAMFIGYPFSITEKNGMEKFYGILPISKKHLVLGRYLYINAIGLLVLLFSCIFHSLILRGLGVIVLMPEICMAAVLGFGIFGFYTIFQLPVFFKYGSLKGKAFLYIPILGYVALVFVFLKFDVTNGWLFSLIIGNPVITVIAVMLIYVISFLISIGVSIRALQNKEV